MGHLVMDESFVIRAIKIQIPRLLSGIISLSKEAQKELIDDACFSTWSVLAASRTDTRC